MKTPINLKTLASAKFDVLDAISMDPRVTAGEFRVAYRLLQHANGETGRIFPAQERIADQCGLKERQVRNCIAGLVEKGWLRHERSNRHLSNIYVFLADNVNAVLDRQTSLADVRADQKSMGKWKVLRGNRLPVRKADQVEGDSIVTGNGLPVANGLTGNGLPLSTGNLLPVLTGNGLPPNTLSITPEENTCDSQGTEEVVVVTGTDLDEGQAAPGATQTATKPPVLSSAEIPESASSRSSIGPEEDFTDDQQPQETLGSVSDPSDDDQRGELFSPISLEDMRGIMAARRINDDVARPPIDNLQPVAGPSARLLANMDKRGGR